MLPFVDIEPTQADQGLARGFAQELLIEPARNADLRVVSHLSSFLFAGTETPLSEIGKRLRCRHLVDGRVRRDDENVRIGVELIEAESGDIVWAEDHRIGVAQLAPLHDQLVQQIAGSIHYKSGEPPPLRRSSSPPPRSLDVYALTNHALALWFKRTPESIREAKSLLERVVAIDPEYARGRATLAILNNGEAHMRLTGDWKPGIAGECMAHARRAVELDPESPTAYRALSLAYLLALDYPTALKFAQRAVELAPSQGEALNVLSIVQIRMGLLEPALLSIEAAMDRLPVPPAWVLHQYGFILWANGHLKDALQAADECVAKMPTYRWGHTLRMYALVELGRLEEARREATLVLQQAPWMTMKKLLPFVGSAVALQERMRAVSIAAGIPEG